VSSYKQAGEQLALSKVTLSRAHPTTQKKMLFSLMLSSKGEVRGGKTTIKFNNCI